MEELRKALKKQISRAIELCESADRSFDQSTYVCLIKCHKELLDAAIDICKSTGIDYAQIYKEAYWDYQEDGEYVNRDHMEDPYKEVI